MNESERAELDVLFLMTPDKHKFGIELGYVPPQPVQDALERLMFRDWIRLVDVSPVPSAKPGVLFRVFRVMPEAVEWFESKKDS